MFYYLAQTFWFVCAPSHIGVWLALAAALLLYRKRERAARHCAIAAAAVLIVLGFTPVSVWAMRPIENTYPRAPLPQQVDGILILGGGSDGEIYTSRGAPNADLGLARLVAGYGVARQHPEARVVFTGGPFPVEDPRSEARAAREILLGLGLQPSRLTIEARSLNTWENFVLSRALVKPKPGDTWVVVTSALHMPRTMAIASKANWPMIPWPADYMTANSSHYEMRDFTANLRRSDMAFHEAVGLLVYRLSGKAH
jgi:uncharacterized SAM-binding protein YcdF (DUF218 family)